MTLDDLLRWHRAQAKATTGDLRELHLQAARLIRGVLRQRSDHREAIVAGFAANRAAGKSTGGRARIDPAIEKRIRNLLKDGIGTRAIMAEVGCGAAAIVRVKHEMGVPPGKPGRPAEDG